VKNAKKPIVVIVDEVYKKGRDIFDSVEEFDIVVASADESLLSKVIRDEEAFAVVLGTEKYTEALYQALQKCGVIARFGVGMDGLNFEKIQQNQLLVTNTPGVLEHTVAELTVFLAGEVMRKSGILSEKIKEGIWQPEVGTELKNKVWGIVGLGNIGKKVSKILSFGFGARVFACDVNSVGEEKVGEKYGVEKIYTDYAELAPFVDILSLHLPANHGTYHYLNEVRLKQLKPGAIVVNTARGSLINENDLYDALEKGYLSGAGLDVFENEPYIPVEPGRDLRELSNVVLTPHIASYTAECSRRMAERVIKNIQLAITENYKQMDIVSF